VLILKLNRLGVSPTHLLTLLDYFNRQGIQLVSIDDQLDTRTTEGQWLFPLMAEIGDMEASLGRERILKGLVTAKEKGVQLGRPCKTANIEKAIHLYQTTNAQIQQIVTQCHITAPTLYRHLSKRRIELRG
ncbi:recombinase family protein, partial [Vagococcus sp. BWB3-3]